MNYSGKRPQTAASDAEPPDAELRKTRRGVKKEDPDAELRASSIPDAELKKNGSHQSESREFR